MISILGILLGILSVAALLFHHSVCWAVCPQALIVMFVRQSLRAYDSLGAADWPDLIAAVSYPVIVTRLLKRAQQRGVLRRGMIYLVMTHLIAIAAAFWLMLVRDHFWGF
jgi:hypothetical protein